MAFKTIYLVRGSKNESYPAFKGRILDILKKVSEAHHPPALWVTITVEKPPKYTIIPFKKAKIAAISMRTEGSLSVIEITGQPGFSGAYGVDEAIPVAYTKEWPDGTTTPGVNLLTLFARKPGISREAFIHRWHNSHTPLSLKIHPLWNYNRNVVTEKLTENSPGYEGIVEEQVRTRQDLMNPFRFFGNALTIIPRMIMVYTDTKAFLDYKNIETYLCEEIVIRSSGLNV